MTTQPDEWHAPDEDVSQFSTPLAPDGARRLRSATAKMAAVCLLPLVITAAIAIGGRAIDDTAVRVQQVSAGTLTALGALLLVIGMLQVRASVGAHVIDNATMRRGAMVLTGAAVFAWLGVVVLWALAFAAPNGSDASLNAAILSIPFGGTAVIATFVRRLPGRIMPH